MGMGKLGLGINQRTPHVDMLLIRPYHVPDVRNFTK